MRDDKAKLLDVLCKAFDLVVDVVRSGSDGGRIDGKSYNEYFTFQRLPDGRIDYSFMWLTYGHAGYFTIDSLKKNYGEKPLEMARMIVLDCIKGERFGSTEDFDEFMKELEKRLAPRIMDAEDFVLLPSEKC